VKCSEEFLIQYNIIFENIYIFEILNIFVSFNSKFKKERRTIISVRSSVNMCTCRHYAHVRHYQSKRDEITPTILPVIPNHEVNILYP
jgi:hypothetical protein